MLWDKTDDICKGGHETKMACRKVSFGLAEDFEAPGDVYDYGT